MLDRTPHVFISYSWTSEEFKNRVIELATYLVNDGIDVKLDVWDLKDGQDKYAFMEQCVTDSSIDKVLIICDSGYAKKADARKGGVGDETVIISPKVYGNVKQEKFIPVIMERDKNGVPYMPAYLKGRMYKDLTGDNYDSGYQELIRNIYEQPSRRKPELGTKPSWLDEKEPAALFPIKEAERKIQAHMGKISSAAVSDFIDVYLEAIEKFYKKNISPEEYLEYFNAMKEYRDVFLDYIKRASETTDHFGSFMADTFEKLYNTLFDVKTFEKKGISANYEDFDLFRLHIWELFVCTVTYLLHKEAYKDLNELLVHTYFLRTSPLSNEIQPFSYEMIRFRSDMMEETIKPNASDELKSKYTLTGHYLCNEREYPPIYTGRNIANADLFLYQVYNGLGLEDLTRGYAWFPTCYIYADRHDSIWERLISKRFCEKIMPLFGVITIDDLKERIALCTPDRDMRYRRGYPMSATAILNWIKLEDVGILP